ncbi:PepSY-associated TM helix domain-containing protein [Derxia lacustris]|uniref:PepSY-associated TM helix domain-containing protein n=1 Tax=Derxia lacustris TaxID=764842 RepID=UPI002E26FCC6
MEIRPLLLKFHRWVGLASALFLFVAGLTGAVISWDHELDAWLNPGLFRATSAGAPLPAIELAARVEAADERVRVSWLPLAAEPGHALLMQVEPRGGAGGGQPSAVDYNQVAVDPVSGAVVGRRFWGAMSLDRENLLPFLYKLHYSLHLPEVGALELGVILMGGIAIGWVLDCFVSLWLAFPSRRGWRKSFAFRWRRGGHALTFDLHRSGGVWLWAILLVMAVTSVSMNLGQEVVRPIVGSLSALTPSVFEMRTPAPPDAKVEEPRLNRAQALALAMRIAREQGIAEPPGGIFHATRYGIYRIGFFGAGEEHGDGGLGNPWITLDANSGAVLAVERPGFGTAGDVFMQAQFPLHSGRILGLPGRVLVSFMGVAVATLSVTGVVIWLRKRRARAVQARLPMRSAVGS